MTEPIRLLLVVAVAVMVSGMAAEAFRRWALRRAILDIPNDRSLHAVPTPRGGGVGIVLGSVAALLLWYLLGGTFSIRALGWIVGALLVAGVSLIDDLRSLPASVRLATHIVGSLILTLVGVQGGELPLLVTVPLAFLWIALVTNIYNFMDGIDGLAAGQGIVAGVTYAVAGAIFGNPLVTAVGAIIAAACAGFLVHNLPPARLFMGDVSSTFLGFSFAGLALLGNLGVGGARTPLELGVIALAPFLFDGVVTLARRLLRGERWFEAHRTHYYQRLVGAGWTHGQVTLLYAGLAVFCAAFGLYAMVLGEPARLILLALLLLPLFGVVVLVGRTEHRSTRIVSS